MSDEKASCDLRIEITVIANYGLGRSTRGRQVWAA